MSHGRRFTQTMRSTAELVGILLYSNVDRSRLQYCQVVQEHVCVYLTVDAVECSCFVDSALAWVRGSSGPIHRPGNPESASSIGTGLMWGQLPQYPDYVSGLRLCRHTVAMMLSSPKYRGPNIILVDHTQPSISIQPLPCYLLSRLHITIRPSLGNLQRWLHLRCSKVHLIRAR